MTSQRKVTFLVQFSSDYLATIHWIFAVLPGALDPSKCTCSGEGLAHAIAGQPISFRVHTLDLHGNTRTQGGDTFTVTAQLQGDTGTISGSHHGTVEDLGQGVYRAAYTATAAGSYEVSVASSDGKVPEQLLSYP